MLHINNTYTDPYFNLASEKYLLQNSTKDVFMMWQNEPSVIIGKYQEVNAEVAVEYAKKNHIQIARRISGGGAVYHDLGNVNLTFIERNGKYDFSKYPQMIIDFLRTIGVEAKQDTRLGLEIDGLKISGSAQYVFKNMSLFHATLLFSSDLMVLENVLLKSENRLKSRFVKSVNSPVTNICEHIKAPMQIDDFKERIMSYFVGESYVFDKKDFALIEQLKTEQQ